MATFSFRKQTIVDVQNVGNLVHRLSVGFYTVQRRFYLLYLFVLFFIGFIYRPHVLIPRSGRQVRESGT